MDPYCKKCRKEIDPFNSGYSWMENKFKDGKWVTKLNRTCNECTEKILQYFFEKRKKYKVLWECPETRKG